MGKALGFLSPGYTLWGTNIASYSPVSQPVSGLGLGPTAPFMKALSCILLLLGVAGIFQGISEMNPWTRWICAGLLAPSPVGAIGCGTFTLESMMLHSLGFVLALRSPVVSFLVTGIMLRRISRWKGFVNGLVLASPLALVLFVLFFATFKPAASGAGLGVARLTQRVLIVEVHAWFVAFACLVW